jgi:uncharacterized protein involved in exopolysaccharide biosynthesis
VNGRPSTGGQEEHSAETLELIDLKKVRDYGLFILHSVRRHPFVALGTFVLVVCLTLTLLAVFPRYYHVEAELLAQRNLLMPALGNPGRNVPTDADAPTRAAPETVRRRDNLISLMKQTNLAARWEQTKAPIIRLRDWVVKLVAPPTEEEKQEELVDMLEKHLYVIASEGTVTIAIDWPDAQLAFQLVETAQQNFLDARHAAEVSSIAEAISILERHAAEVQSSIDTAMEEIRRSEPTHTVRAGSPSPRPAKPKETAEPSEVSQLKGLLDGKRRAIHDLEAFRTRRLTELKDDLDKQKQVYADAHPNVVRLKESIAAMTADSPQLAELRREEHELAAEFTQAGGDKPAQRENEVHIAAPQLSEARRVLSTGADPSAEQYAYAKARLRFAMNTYDSLIDRLDAARIELDTARAAFKYRYTTIRPAELPKHVAKPKVPVVIAAGVLAALLLAALMAALVDLKSKKLVERWQVERMLGLGVLGEMPRS